MKIKILKYKTWNICLAIIFVLFVEQGLEGETVQSGEDSSSGFALEVHPAADGAVVLAARLVQMDAGHLAAGSEVDVADVCDATCRRRKTISSQLTSFMYFFVVVAMF